MRSYVHFLWGTGIAAGLLAGVVFVRQPLSAMSDVHATCEYEARRAANLAGEFEKYLDRMAAKCEVVNDCLAGRLSLDQASVKLEEIYADEPQHLRDFAVFQHSARSVGQLHRRRLITFLETQLLDRVDWPADRAARLQADLDEFRRREFAN